MERAEFSKSTMRAALERQDYRCGSCGVYIYNLGGEVGWHAFGERVEAHHIRHAHAGGDASVENCVIICRSCHYSAHGGGDYQDNTEAMQGRPRNFPCYNGTKREDSRCTKLAKEMDDKFGGPLQSK